LQGETILLVDDDLAIRRLTKVYLEQAGYNVLAAGDGVTGLRVFEEHQGCIKLLLTDVMMPEMNGLKLADTVLELNPRLPVLFMSGNVYDADRGHGNIAKPFTAVDLVSKVRQVLSAANNRLC
jgi:two-component system cell cycle sensor histidine kinase/response regulator CckA